MLTTTSLSLGFGSLQTVVQRSLPVKVLGLRQVHLL